MNALLPLFAAPAAGADAKAANLPAAARALSPHLNRSRPLDRKLVSGVTTTTFGASDAKGAGLWRDAYDCRVSRGWRAHRTRSVKILHGSSCSSHVPFAVAIAAPRSSSVVLAQTPLTAPPNRNRACVAEPWAS